MEGVKKFKVWGDDTMGDTKLYSTQAFFNFRYVTNKLNGKKQTYYFGIQLLRKYRKIKRNRTRSKYNSSFQYHLASKDLKDPIPFVNTLGTIEHYTFSLFQVLFHQNTCWRRHIQSCSNFSIPW